MSDERKRGGAFTLFITDDRHIVVVARKPCSKWYLLACCSRSKRHYRRDGSCKHIIEAMEAIKPEIRPRVRVDPFGGRKP